MPGRGGAYIRQAAATARQELLKMAAERLQRPATELTLADGEVRPGGIAIRIANWREAARAVDRSDSTSITRQIQQRK